MTGVTSAAALAVGAANAAGTEVRDAATRASAPADATIERAAAERAAVWSFFIGFLPVFERWMRRCGPVWWLLTRVNRGAVE